MKFQALNPGRTSDCFNAGTVAGPSFLNFYKCVFSWTECALQKQENMPENMDTSF